MLTGDKLRGRDTRTQEESGVPFPEREQRKRGIVVQLVVPHPLNFLLAQKLSNWEHGWKDGSGLLFQRIWVLILSTYTEVHNCL